jgi:hypothetical protein
MQPECTRNDRALSLCVDGELPGPERGALEAHLADCARCREVLRQFEQLRGLARELPVRTPPAELRDDVRAALRRASGLRTHGRRGAGLLALAACLGIAAGIGWFGLRQPEPGPVLEPVRQAASGDQMARLLEGLRDPDRDVRAAAAESLGLLGPAAREAVPAIEALMRDPHPEVRAAAQQALEKIR